VREAFFAAADLESLECTEEGRADSPLDDDLYFLWTHASLSSTKLHQPQPLGASATIVDAPGQPWRANKAYPAVGWTHRSS
jgi:hypothetical protein